MAAPKTDGGVAHPTIKSDIKYAPMLPTGQDLSSVILYYTGNPEYDIRDNVVSAKMDLTTEGSHKVTIQVVDPSRKLLRSGYLGTHTDIRIFYTQHEAWWRLASVSKQGELLTLVFEDRHVQILKSFNKKLLVDKGKLNRCEFVWRLVMEAQAKDPRLDYNGPCVGRPGAKTRVSDNLQGISQHPNPYTPAVPFKPSAKFNVRIKTLKPRADQLKNINAILDTGAGMKVRRKIMVASIMTAIGESSITNYECVQKYGMCPDGPIGVFQQFHSFGWPASRDVAKDAGAYFRAAIAVDKQYPNISYEELGTKTQNSGWNFQMDSSLGKYTKYVGQYRNEAEKIVDAWGYSGEDIRKHVDPANPDSGATVGAGDSQDPFAIPPNWSLASGDTSSQQWHRGSPKNTTGRSAWTKENSWDCIERMANEVNWYKFMVWDELHFRPSDDFFTVGSDDIQEFETDDIGYIDGDYDRNKKTGTVTINTFSDQWVWLPGQTLNLVKMGPWDGLWWVTEVQMDLIGSTDCQVTLKKPIKPLSEAQAEAKGKKSQQGLTGGELPGSKGAKEDPRGGPYDLGIVINGKAPLCDQYISHITDNLETHVAVDIMANAGTPIHAPEDLVIDYWGSAQGGASLAAFGGSGIHYWFGHLMDGGRPSPGDHVKKYDVIGYVYNQGGNSHVHVGMDTRAAAGFQICGCTNYGQGGCGCGTICQQLNGKK